MTLAGGGSANELLHGGAVVPDVVARPWRRRDYLRVYIGPNWEDYVGVFDDMEKKPGLAPSWSWTACLFPAIWLVYRRRYASAAAIFVVNIAVNHLLRGWAYLGAVLAVLLIPGLLGKALYIRSALKTIDPILAAQPDQHARVALVEARGGVSDRGVMIVVCVLVALWIVLDVLPFVRW